MIVLTLSTAFGWRFASNAYESTYRSLVGRNYRIDTEYTSAERAQVALGASMWDSGPGRRVRGANFRFTRGTDVSVSVSCNGRNEVRLYNKTQMGMRGAANSLGIMTYCHPVGVLFTSQLAAVSAGTLNIDIGLAQSIDWCLGSTHNACIGVGYSMAQVAMHEFGHFAGFNHENNLISVMRANYGGNWDIGGQAWIAENDAAGLQAQYADSSTGVDLGVKAFTLADGPTWRTGLRVWDLGNASWSANSDPPSAVNATMIGTGSVAAPMRWYVTSNTCTSTPQWTVGTRTPTMSTNVPYAVDPSGGYDFSAVPPGFYRLCVRIDPNNAISETDESNNVEGSEFGFILVQP
ncbi:MAG: matrixin family metalloprotease [Alphaproteobacteria bacterium]|nr:matrixin family metalloprotease [Alphaproteobacteria bacterium]MCB9693977.1 matrixin family metalloprotease [Alphaproteobacteria bacterium]